MPTYRLKPYRYLLIAGCIVAFGSHAQPVLESYETNTGFVANATANKPSGTTSGDVLVVGLMIEKGNSETITPPAGWTLIRRTNNGTEVAIASYYKVAGGSEPASYDFIISNASKWCTGINRISNVNSVAPIDVSTESTGYGTSVTAPTLTTTGAQRLILCFYTNKKDATYSPAGGTTEIYDAPNTVGGIPSNMMASFSQAVAGASGNKSATASETEEWAAQQIAIMPDYILPVELMNFSATLRNGAVQMDWVTATEVNNDHFTVERSKNGFDYETVAMVSGAGNSNRVLNYALVDDKPLPGMSYYRLKQTDFDGDHSYSYPVPIRNEDFGSINVFPNPTSRNITVQFTEGEVEDLQLYNLMGQEMRDLIELRAQSHSRLVVDLSQVPAGTYLLRANNLSQLVYKQ